MCSCVEKNWTMTHMNYAHKRTRHAFVCDELRWGTREGELIFWKTNELVFAIVRVFINALTDSTASINCSSLEQKFKKTPYLSGISYTIRSRIYSEGNLIIYWYKFFLFYFSLSFSLCFSLSLPLVSPTRYAHCTSCINLPRRSKNYKFHYTDMTRKRSTCYVYVQLGHGPHFKNTRRAVSMSCRKWWKRIVPE